METPARLTVEDTKPRSKISVEAQILPGFLHKPTAGPQGANARLNLPGIGHELPWMRHAAQYVALGTMTQAAIAELCGVSKDQIFELFRTPWFMERVRELMDEGQDSVMALLKSAGTDAAVTLIEICNNPKASTPSRIAAAKEILDRNLGKSVTLVESKTLHMSNDPVADVARLESEVNRLRSQGNGPLIQLNS